MERRRESDRLKMLEVQSSSKEGLDIVPFVRQLERAQSHLKFLWMGIMNTRADKANANNELIENGVLTDEELRKLDTLDQREVYTAPLRFFEPINDSAGRTSWFMDVIQAAMRLATDQGESEKEFRSYETEYGRVKALEVIFAQAVTNMGGSACSLTLRDYVAQCPSYI